MDVTHNVTALMYDVIVQYFQVLGSLNVFLFCRYWYKNGLLYPDALSVFIPVDRCNKANGCLQVPIDVLEKFE